MSIKEPTIFTFSGEIKAVDSIIRIEEIEDETFLFLDDHTKSKSVLSIDVLEWELPKEMFTRVHPKHLINNNFSKRLFHTTSQWIELENGEKVPITQELTKNKKLIEKNKHLFSWFKKVK